MTPNRVGKRVSITGEKQKGEVKGQDQHEAGDPQGLRVMGGSMFMVVGTVQPHPRKILKTVIMFNFSPHIYAPIR